MKVCITEADMQEAGAREEQVRGLPHEAMTEHQNDNKNKSKVPYISYYVRMNKTEQPAIGKT